MGLELRTPPLPHESTFKGTLFGFNPTVKEPYIIKHSKFGFRFSIQSFIILVD